jgi:hypothetical protein
MQVRRVLTVVAVSVLGLIGAGYIAIVCCLPIFGDPEPPPGVSIVNRTDQALKVYSVIVTVDPDTPDRRLIAEIPPHGMTEAAGGPCIGLWVARAPDRTIVARIGPFDDCNEGPWIIRP